MEVGRKQLADHIQHQFEIGKPVEINGELYWLKDVKQNLQDIMDDIESAWNDEHGVKRFIVPISIPEFMTIRAFADRILVRPAEIIKWLFLPSTDR